MEKLSFSPLKLEKKKMWLILVALFLLSFISDLMNSKALTSYYTYQRDVMGYEVSIFSDEAGFYAVISVLTSLLGLIPMCFVLSWVRQSISDEKFRCYVRYFFYVFIAFAVIEAMSTMDSIPEESDGVDLLGAAVHEIIAVIVSLVWLVFYILADIICIRKGDRDVKNFGLIWLIIGLILPIIFAWISEDVKGFAQIMLIIVGNICGVYPYVYLINKTKVDEVMIENEQNAEINKTPEDEEAKKKRTKRIILISLAITLVLNLLRFIIK